MGSDCGNGCSVFFKHRDNHFFPPWAYAVAAAITQLPLAFVETTILTIIVYFMAGFYYSAGELAPSPSPVPHSPSNPG